MKKVTNPSSGVHRRQGNGYHVTPEEIAQYNEQGYLVLNDALTEAELATIDPYFELLVAGTKADEMKKDFCDMSQPYGTPIEDFKLVNAMLPSKYCPELVNNIYFQIAQSIADQLYTGEAKMDYEQFLAKKPQKSGAEFAMHQDLGYWPKTENTWTATISLALNDADVENGCLQVVPSSNKEPELRNHFPKQFSAPAHTDEIKRDESHTLEIEMKDTDEVVYLPVRRGSVTVHDERIVHGSGGNTTDEWRKTYVMAFRDADTIAQERAIGFTHSHNDEVNWNEIIK
jgi:ectoine hydroxylase-related dioxygenase (phytanoyl-CoA dioxygenase family)